MNHKTRLGPVAIFLTVVAMVITTLALLTLATSNADRTMSGRFASVTQTRYRLEADGELFLSEAARGTGFGDGYASEKTVNRTAEGYEFYEELNGYSITVEISEPDSEGQIEVLSWKLSKLWNSEDPINDIWPGF